MAVAKLKKLLIITHKSDEDSLLKNLQKAAIAEIRPYKEKIDATTLHLSPTSEYTSNIKKVLEIFYNYKEGKKIASKAGKLVLKKDEYENNCGEAPSYYSSIPPPPNSVVDIPK